MKNMPWRWTFTHVFLKPVLCTLNAIYALVSYRKSQDTNFHIYFPRFSLGRDSRDVDHHHHHTHHTDRYIDTYLYVNDSHVFSSPLSLSSFAASSFVTVDCVSTPSIVCDVVVVRFLRIPSMCTIKRMCCVVCFHWFFVFMLLLLT